MSDTACKGDDNCIECAPEVEVWPVGTGDLMRELAEALRDVVSTARYNLPACKEADTGACVVTNGEACWCGQPEAWDDYCKLRAPLARYDAMTGDSDD